MLSPGELERDSVVHSSSIIYVRPAPDDESIAVMTVRSNGSIEDTASIVDLTAPTTEGKGVTVKCPSALTLGWSILAEEIAASADVNLFAICVNNNSDI